MGDTKQKELPTRWIKEPVEPHRRTCIFLHGRGDSGPVFGTFLFDGAEGSAGMTLPQQFPDMKFICPTAEKRRFKNSQICMPQWFDIDSLKDPSLNEDDQAEALRESIHYILGIIDEEVRLLGDPNKVFIGGLSQGCATSLHVLLTYGQQLGGFVGMSGWFPFVRSVQNILKDSSASSNLNAGEGLTRAREKVTQDLREFFGLPPLSSTHLIKWFETPFWLGHGSLDDKVDVKLGLEIRQVISDLGVLVDWNVYEFGHWYQAPQEIDDIAGFLQKVVPEYQETSFKEKVAAIFQAG